MLVIIIIAALLASAAALVFWSRPAAPASAQTSEDGVLVKQGSFLTNSTSGAQVVTGVGFQPKAVIFYWTGEDTATGTKDEVRLGVGLSNGIPSSDVRHSAAISGKYSVGSYTNTASSSRGQDITLFNSFNTTVSAKVNSLDSNGFTLSWAQASGGAYLIHFIAIGGSDITNTSVGEFVIDNTGLSNMGIDTGFKPDFVFMISNGVRDIVNTPAYPYPANLSLGFGSGPNNQGVVNIFSNNGSATSATCSRQRTDHIVSLVNSNCNSFVLAKLFSMYENGFSLTKVDSNATEQTVYYLAIKGGSWNVGSFNKKTSAGTQPVPLGDVDFVPNGLMLFSRNQTTNSNVTSNADFSIGAASGATNRGAVGVSGPDGAIALSPDRRTLTNKIFTHINGTGGTLVNEADLTSFDNEGFTLNWTNADANANEILYWAVGSKPTLEQSGYRWFENRDELDGAKGTVGGTQKVSELSGGGPVLDPSDLYGSSIASLGDLDGDGVGDLAVGVFGDDDGGTDAGAIYIHFMNTNGTVKSTQKVSELSGGGPTLDDFDHYGSSIAFLGDLDGDGVSAIAVGANFDDDGWSAAGAIYVHFMNSGKALVGSSLASQNTAATLSSSTPPFRLQMLAHVGGGKLAKNGGDFRLQYAQKSGSCDTGFSGETYQNVETASDIIRFHNNDNLANGNVPLITTSTPTHSGHTRKAQVYRESSGSFSNSNTAISVGEDGLWDFSLKLANASSSTSYCFRVVNADASSTPFASYSVIPEIITPAATISFNELVQKNYRWYRGVDTKDPANNQAIADENAAMTNLAQNRSRHLRISVESPSGNLASGQTLKLQYQKSTTTGTWYNLGAADGAGTVRFSGADFGCCTDGVAITALRLTGSNVLQTYEEDNGSNDHLSAATPNAITVGKIAEWNWAIRIGIAEASATYYFRMAGSDGTPFASYTNYPKVVVLSSGGATSSGELSSVIYDTQSVNGAQLNSFFWDGPQPETNDYVRFQFASASTTSPAGGWDSLWKGPDGTSATWYGGGTPPTGPNATAAITPSNHANHRYFRYKVRLESSSGISPVVRRVIINWSP